MINQVEQVEVNLPPVPTTHWNWRAYPLGVTAEAKTNAAAWDSFIHSWRRIREYRMIERLRRSYHERGQLRV